MACIALGITTSVAIAQTPAAASELFGEDGVPFYAARFNSEDYDGHRQNWAVAQATDGAIWVGNSEGLLRYDGAAWSRVPIPGRVVRSLAIGEDGRLFVGGIGTFGAINATAAGRPTYLELSGEVDLKGSDVWATVAGGRSIFFQTSTGIFEHDGGLTREIAATGQEYAFHKLFALRQAGSTRLYVRQEGVGLLAYEPSNRRFVAVEGGALFATEKIWALFAEREGLLAVTANRLVRVHSGGARTLNTPALTSLLQRHRAYDGISLGGGRHAIGTLGGGVLIVDSHGHVVQRLGARAGLTEDDLIFDMAIDSQRGIWVALANGIARLDVAAPLSKFDSDLGLPGTVHDLARHRGQIFVATDVGTYRLTPSSSSGELPHFEPVGRRGQTWALLSTESELLVAGTAGVYALGSGGELQTLTHSPSYTLRRVLATEDVVYAGSESGVEVVVRRGGRWEARGPVRAINGTVRSMSEDGYGRLWLATPDRVIQVQPMQDINDVTRIITQYDLYDSVVANLHGVAIVSGSSVRRPSTDARLVPDTTLTRLFSQSDSTRVLAWAADSAERLWMSQGGIVSGFEWSEQSWLEITPPAIRTLRVGLRAVLAEEAVLWIGTESQLLRYDVHRGSADRYATSNQVLMSGFTVNHQEQLWSGGAPGYLAPGRFAVRSGFNSVRFNFAAPSYNDAPATRYRTRLEGYEEEWTDWSTEPWREFTSLPPGSYTLEMAAINGQGVEFRPLAIHLNVEPRWHETWWSRFSFALLALAIVFGIAYQRVGVHRRRAIAEAARADELARLNEELVEADKLKDELLANTSHELRTPLTAIMGYADLLCEFDGSETPSDVRATAGFIVGGANRLYRTVEDMMDTAAIRAGRMETFPEKLNLSAVAETVAERLRDTAHSKGLALRTERETTDGSAIDCFSVVADRRAVTRILEHLIENAIKFTEMGAVEVTTRFDGASGTVAVAVADTGPGIASSLIPLLFTPFKQESTGFGRRHEGNGLGLSVAAGLTEAIGARLSVDSELAHGTVITLSFDAQHGANRRALDNGVLNGVCENQSSISV